MPRVGLLRRFPAADRCCLSQTPFSRRLLHVGCTRTAALVPPASPTPTGGAARCVNTERPLDPAPSAKGRDPVANSTEHRFTHVTSGRRALVAAWVRTKTHLPVLYSIAWADACAALVEDGWSTACRALLAQMLDPTAVDQAARGRLCTRHLAVRVGPRRAAGLLTYVKLAEALRRGLSLLVDLDPDSDVLQ